MQTWVDQNRLECLHEEADLLGLGRCPLPLTERAHTGAEAGYCLSLETGS